jgi:hypothetical protein
MEETIQVNLRLPKELVEDLEFVAKQFKVKKSEWLKVKIAELVSRELRDEKWRLHHYADEKYIRGVISDSEYEQRKGKKPSNELKSLRSNEQKKQEYMDKHKEEYSRNYFDQLKKSM